MSETPATDRALADLEYLLAEGYIDTWQAQRGRDVVGLLFDADTVYASIGPIDDGELSFYWKAGDRSVSLDLRRDGDDWASVVDGARHRWTYDGSAVRPELRDHLHQFSAHVQAVNPSWRDQPA
jgi:hypothetical protein